MKTIIISTFIGILSMTATINANSQNKSKYITQQIQVSGTCSQCKARIEKAALIKGVRLAQWDKNTKMLKLIYQDSKTDSLKILQSIANAGHDNKLFKSSDEAYQKLPDCCKYRDGIGSH